MPKQKILITGGVGMIGKALIRILYRDYYLIVLDKKSFCQALDLTLFLNSI